MAVSPLKICTAGINCKSTECRFDHPGGRRIRTPVSSPDPSPKDVLSSSAPDEKNPPKAMKKLDMASMLPTAKSLDSSVSAPLADNGASFEKVVYRKSRGKKDRKKLPSPAPKSSTKERAKPKGVFKANSARQYGRRKSYDHTSTSPGRQSGLRGDSERTRSNPNSYRPPNSSRTSRTARSKPSSSRGHHHDRNNSSSARGPASHRSNPSPGRQLLAKTSHARHNRVRVVINGETMDTVGPLTARSGRSHSSRPHHQRSISHDASPTASDDGVRIRQGSQTPRVRKNGGDFLREGNNFLNGRHPLGQDYKKAEQLLRQASELGHSGAYKSIVILGYRYLNGDGCDVNVAKAEELFHMAADANYRGGAKALFSLGIRYWYGEGVEKDLDKMEQAYLKAARLGSKDAAKGLFTMGIRYSNGDQVPRDYAKAEEYYIRAAEAGYADAAKALLTLGIRYSNGDRVECNHIKAEDLFEKAAQHGSANGAKALCTLGIRYSEGMDGGEPDFAKAEELCLKAASYGHTQAAKALVVMGYRFADGDLIDQDTNKAEELFEKAAELGHFDAAKGMFSLGVKFSNGENVAMNIDKAIALMQRAADLGFHPGAKGLKKIGQRFSNGTLGVERDYARAEALYRLSASAGNQEGCQKPIFTLAFRYANGEGTPEDLDKAVELFRLSNECGHPDVGKALCIVASQHVDKAGADPSSVLAAEQLIDSAVELGYRRAYDSLVKLGLFFLKGKCDAIAGERALSSANSAKGVACFERALGMGSSEAAVQLGHCYTYGDGVEKDAAKAASYYEQAKSLAEAEAIADEEERNERTSNAVPPTDFSPPPGL